MRKFKTKFNPEEAVVNRKILADIENNRSKASLRPSIQCPRCGAEEMHPVDHTLLIRAYKVDDWSECLVCASADVGAKGGYDKDLVWTGPFERGNQNEMAWF